MGPSGSGKTTLLNLIAGIDQPTRGRIVIGGRDISQMSQTELARWRSSTIGFIFQLYNLMPVLTAFENVELPLLLTSLKKAERKQARRGGPRRSSTSRTGWTITRASSRAGRSSGSRSRGRSSPTRRSSSPTSRRATSTRSRPRRSWSS